MIDIVYFIWININRPYKIIIEGQLEDIILSNILVDGFLHIVISLDKNIQINIENIINNSLHNYKNKYNIDFFYDNHYEYYGIKKLYDLALINPNKYFFYMHSKGMHSSYNCIERTHHEKILTKGHLNKYTTVIDIFNNNKEIVSAGLFPGDLFYGNKNYIWFNFFYVKGSYLNTCESPKISDDNRFYYEFWLGNSSLKNNENIKIYNLLNNNYDKFSTKEASMLIGSGNHINKLLNL